MAALFFVKTGILVVILRRKVKKNAKVPHNIYRKYLKL